MAYMNQEKKAKIAAELKKVVPKDWKYSLAVYHGSTIALTVKSAKSDLVKEYVTVARERGMHARTYAEADEPMPSYCNVNDKWARHYFDGAPEGEKFLKVIAALNLDNHDKSDIQTDYFDVGHYVSFNLGKWDKPFVVEK